MQDSFVTVEMTKLYPRKDDYIGDAAACNQRKDNAPTAASNPALFPRLNEDERATHRPPSVSSVSASELADDKAEPTTESTEAINARLNALFAACFSSNAKGLIHHLKPYNLTSDETNVVVLITRIGVLALRGQVPWQQLASTLGDIINTDRFACVAHAYLKLSLQAHQPITIAFSKLLRHRSLRDFWQQQITGSDTNPPYKNFSPDRLMDPDQHPLVRVVAAFFRDEMEHAKRVCAHMESIQKNLTAAYLSVFNYDYMVGLVRRALQHVKFSYQSHKQGQSYSLECIEAYSLAHILSPQEAYDQLLSLGEDSSQPIHYKKILIDTRLQLASKLLKEDDLDKALLHFKAIQQYCRSFLVANSDLLQLNLAAHVACFYIQFKQNKLDHKAIDDFYHLVKNVYMQQEINGLAAFLVLAEISTSRGSVTMHDWWMTEARNFATITGQSGELPSPSFDCAEDTNDRCLLIVKLLSKPFKLSARQQIYVTADALLKSQRLYVEACGRFVTQVEHSSLAEAQLTRGSGPGAAA